MNLSAIGENALVEKLTHGLPLGRDVRVGAGDDCAVIGGPRDLWWRLLKTDAVVEGVHFLPKEKPSRIGWKAICRAVSDIAAMGGIAEHVLVTLAVCEKREEHWVLELYEGIKKAAHQFGLSVVGGETSRSPGPAFISIALAGRVERARCVLRGGGKVGDALYVTGLLGGSLSGKHLDFIPRIAEARWLVEHYRPRAMMDLSDGIASDLPRLASASSCGFELWEDAIPLTPGCDTLAAMRDGEDYELLFALAPKIASALECDWRKKFPELPLTRIGTLTNGRNKLNIRGHDHFAKP